MKILRHAALACLLVLGLMIIVGSGSGGGDSAGVGDDPPLGGTPGITYTGLTTQAIIDAYNAESLLTDIFYAADIATQVSMFLGAVQGSGASENHVNLVGVAQALEDALPV